jgi:hypothetical protein
VRQCLREFCIIFSPSHSKVTFLQMLRNTVHQYEHSVCTGFVVFFSSNTCKCKLSSSFSDCAACGLSWSSCNRYKKCHNFMNTTSLKVKTTQFIWHCSITFHGRKVLTDESRTVQGVGAGGCGGGHLHVMLGTRWVKAREYEACQLVIMKIIHCTVQLNGKKSKCST